MLVVLVTWGELEGDGKVEPSYFSKRKTQRVPSVAIQWRSKSMRIRRTSREISPKIHHEIVHIDGGFDPCPAMLFRGF
jgi:hypothetical protein